MTRVTKRYFDAIRSYIEVKHFSPTYEEIEEAKAIKETFEEAMAQGTGATRFRGKMIDLPHYKSAISTLDKADQYSLL